MFSTKWTIKIKKQWFLYDFEYIPVVKYKYTCMSADRLELFGLFQSYVQIVCFLWMRCMWSICVNQQNEVVEWLPKNISIVRKMQRCETESSKTRKHDQTMIRISRIFLNAVLEYYKNRNDSLGFIYIYCCLNGLALYA